MFQPVDVYTKIRCLWILGIGIALEINEDRSVSL